MAGTIPADASLFCPRCKFARLFIDIGGGVLYRCSGCEWPFTLTAVAPSGTASAAITVPASTLAITVASGGASFTSGMYLLYDTGQNAEAVQVRGTPTGTSVPVPSGFAKTHLTAVTFGQLALVPALSGNAQNAVPAVAGWGF